MDEVRSSIQSDDTLRSEISSLSSPSVCDDLIIEEQTELFQDSKTSEVEKSLKEGWTDEDHTASHSQLPTEEKKDNISIETSELICDDTVFPLHRSKWAAIDSFSICILGVGTSLIIGVLIFLSYIWNGSMRAMAGDNMEESFWTLLTDFSMVNVTGSRTTSEIPYAEKPYLGYVMKASKAWSMQPGTYSRFAEKRIDLKESRSESATDYEDTGPVTRAIMPFFSESQRTGLRRYDGPAAVLDSRVFCMLPVVRNLTFEFPFRHLLDTTDTFGYHSIQVSLGSHLVFQLHSVRWQNGQKRSGAETNR
ncbi:hypothetical protein K4K57_007299 [Colletotrichum sp. SAR 10_99]|nr:hypothetical protein K4K55_000457 [Colletotrichum sp. SAR 10_96]KAJ5017840.1 hypothetical protein K4K57_007299 [Colletotrichum sp. SAR 10_99]